MTEPRVLGLDLSTVCPGRCRHDGTTDHYRHRAKRRPDEALHDWYRRRSMLIRDWTADDIVGSSLVACEAIVPHGNQQIPMAYLHAAIDQRARNVIGFKIQNTHLKQYATGYGDADKQLVHDAALTVGWSGPSKCDCCTTALQRADSSCDESDAFWLWVIGRHLEGDPVVDVTPARDDLIYEIRRLRTKASRVRQRRERRPRPAHDFTETR